MYSLQAFPFCQAKKSNTVTTKKGISTKFWNVPFQSSLFRWEELVLACNHSVMPMQVLCLLKTEDARNTQRLLTQDDTDHTSPWPAASKKTSHSFCSLCILQQLPIVFNEEKIGKIMWRCNHLKTLLYKQTKSYAIWKEANYLSWVSSYRRWRSPKHCLSSLQTPEVGEA